MWEVQSLEELSSLLESVTLRAEEDVWSWSLDSEGVFLVKSSYNMFAPVFLDESNLAAEKLFLFDNIWKSSAPTKVMAFSGILCVLLVFVTALVQNCFICYRGFPWCCG